MCVLNGSMSSSVKGLYEPDQSNNQSILHFLCLGIIWGIFRHINQTTAENSNKSVSFNKRRGLFSQKGEAYVQAQAESSAQQSAGSNIHSENSKACMFCTAAVNADPEVNGGSWQYLPTATKDFRMSIEGIRQACCRVLNAAASSQNSILAK